MNYLFFKNSYFPSTIIEWNKLDSNIRNSDTLNIFKSKILKFKRPTANSIFDCHKPIGVKLLTRLQLEVSHLCEHKFKHSFQDTLTPICNASTNFIILSSTIEHILATKRFDEPLLH